MSRDLGSFLILSHGHICNVSKQLMVRLAHAGQDKVSLLGVGSFAKANKTLVLTLLVCFSFSGNVFLYQEVQEALQNSIGSETLSSNFISFLKDFPVWVPVS